MTIEIKKFSSKIALLKFVQNTKIRNGKELRQIAKQILEYIAI